MTTERISYNEATRERRSMVAHDLDAAGQAAIDRMRGVNVQKDAQREGMRARVLNGEAIREEMQRQEMAGLSAGNYVSDEAQLLDSLGHLENAEEIAKVLAYDADRDMSRDGIVDMDSVDHETVGRYDEFGEFIPTPYDERAVYHCRTHMVTVESEDPGKRTERVFNVESYNKLQMKLSTQRARHGIEFAWTVRGDKVRAKLESESEKTERMIRKEARDAKRSEGHARNKAKKLARLQARFANK